MNFFNNSLSARNLSDRKSRIIHWKSPKKSGIVGKDSSGINLIQQNSLETFREKGSVLNNFMHHSPVIANLCQKSLVKALKNKVSQFKKFQIHRKINQGN